MSSVLIEEGPERLGERPERSAKQLPPRAFAYFLLVAAATAAITVPYLLQLDRETTGWLTFAILATCVAVAQFFVVTPPGNKSYHTTGVFLIAAALGVPPARRARRPRSHPRPQSLRPTAGIFDDPFFFDATA